MYYDRITKTAEVTRNNAGLVECGDSHWSRYSFRGPNDRPAAATAWADVSDAGNVRSVQFTCPKHSGIIRGQRTKGSWSYRNAREFDLPVEKVAQDVEGAIAQMEATIKAEETARRIAREKADCDYARAGWEKARADYNAIPTSDELDRIQPTISDIDDDSFGRVYVHVQPRRMTPMAARFLAKRLLALADEAQAKTDAAVKP